MICRQDQETLSRAQNYKDSRHSIKLIVHYIQNAAELQTKNISEVHCCSSQRENSEDA